MPGFGDSIYEHPSFTFENPSRKEQATICAVVSAAIAVASTVAAISLNAVPNPFASLLPAL
ncbi:hypothetical protein BXZ70DRAFT_1009468 [Cristinia sonorae]|uniref:Uncharacterized protein n=1 Tax=Cristinia sonorae TaxID=1940300 RepID=A0A8K0ULH5_9AGAR|nr:hypothetical protein BXZ70DRAFT_1009468 [Cristinia sonorae]